MNTCKQCKRDFQYDDEHGYAKDLCGPFCDGVYSQQKNIAELLRKIAILQGTISKSIVMCEDLAIILEEGLEMGESDEGV